MTASETVSLRTRILATGSLVLIAVVMVGYKYLDYRANPWTRDGQVRANVVQITPRVSGTIVELPIEDNQFVKAGDLLFQIDPRTFQSELDYKQAVLDETIDEIAALEAEIDAEAAAVERTEEEIAWYKQQVIGKRARLKDSRSQFARYTKMLSTGAASQERLDRAEADVIDAEALLEGAVLELRQAEARHEEAVAELARAKAEHGAYGEANARLRSAKAAVHHAELDLEFTSVVAPVDGYITHLDLRLGDHVTAKKAAVALVDVDTYWVYGYFKEVYLDNVQRGDLAIVKLMSYPDEPIWGRVMSIGWGIYQKDGSTGDQLLPEIYDHFEWVRRPQRLPVRVHLGKLPEGVELVRGTNASVLVKTGTTGNPPPEGVEGVPSLLRALK